MHSMTFWSCWSGLTTFLGVLLLLRASPTACTDIHTSQATLASAEWRVRSFYHTTDQLLEEFRSTPCSTGSVTVSDDEEQSIPRVEISSGGSGKENIVLFFGEHARELISPETGLRFFQYLCGNEKSTRAKAKKLLETVNVVIYPVVNVGGRRAIEEQGLYCLRTNREGVDLNRNWDDHWVVGTGL